jgi:proline racemase
MTARRISTIDYHTAGEPFRIVTEPPVAIHGATVAERRVFAMNDPEVDGLRRLLCFEPRGHADMYGGFIVPPDDHGAHLGVLFWHKDGFSTACGHGTIALGAWAVDSGLVPADPSGATEVRIDVPSGRVTARVHRVDGRTTAIDFINVPSSVVATGLEIATSRGDVKVDVAFGGAIYAYLDADAVGLTVTPEHYADLIAIGREIKWRLNEADVARHPTDDRLSGIYGTIIVQSLGTDADGNPHERNVAIFADGEVDRSPCGSATAARIALLADRGELHAGQDLVNDSIVGSRFLGRIVAGATVDGRPAVVSEVTGMAYRTGEHTFELDPDDPLSEGFVLR